MTSTRRETELLRLGADQLPRPGAVGAENSVTSCDLQILVSQATEAVSS
jgi:hypothetical protein